MFSDRTDAGRRLARRLLHLADHDVVVVGLPRGGVPVAREVAEALQAPLDLIVVRKLGVPFQTELAMGAIGEDGVRVVEEAIVRRAGVSPDELADVEAAGRAELDRRVRRFRGGRTRVPLAGREVVVVDDGIATGATARAACQVARAEGARRVILAVPVAPPGWASRFADVADECVCVATPSSFRDIGRFYDDFDQTSDAEVLACLAGGPVPGDEDVDVRLGDVTLPGRLTVPAGARGVVVFAHGSGSSRFSPRNRSVARVLEAAGLATLLFDLLTPAEESDRGNVFDVGLLGARLAAATAWLRVRPGFGLLPLGYFGASTGASAALTAAAERSDVAAVVSRGGRPDLAGPALGGVRAPTLLVVGELDRTVLHLNEQALARLPEGSSRLVVVRGATHLFEEPGTLASAAGLARDWFVTHLGVPSRSGAGGT
jgi:putative phosphoribosyl transferase